MSDVDCRFDGDDQIVTVRVKLAEIGPPEYTTPEGAQVWPLSRTLTIAVAKLTDEIAKEPQS